MDVLAGRKTNWDDPKNKKAIKIESTKITPSPKKYPVFHQELQYVSAAQESIKKEKLLKEGRGRDEKNEKTRILAICCAYAKKSFQLV